MTYSYDPSGQITTQTETRLGSSTDSETQCYTYDPLDQLTAAWSATDQCATAPTSTAHTQVANTRGTNSAYWTSWTYKTDGLSQGNRLTQTQHAIGTATQDTTTSYTYNGNGANQPGTLTSTSGGSGGATSYTYDTAGNMTTRTTTATGTQTLNWDNAGRLYSTSSTTGTTTGYIYDADGNLLIQTDPATTTLYLPGEQITLTNGTTTETSVRYYPLPGGGTAVRTGSGTSYGFEIADPHGTNTLRLDSTAQTPTWRQFDPYGNPRGTAVTWTDNRIFLNKPTDTSTGLTSVGARYYDPTTGRFTSLDPVLEAGDPQALNGYAYTDNNPINSSDPTGQRAAGDANGSTCNNQGQCSGDKSDGPSLCTVNPTGPGCDPAAECSSSDVECQVVKKKVDDTIPTKLFKQYGWFVPSLWQMVDWGDFDPGLTFAQNVALYYRARCSADMAQLGCLDIAQYYGHWSGLSAIPENPCGIMTLCDATKFMLAGTGLAAEEAGSIIDSELEAGNTTLATGQSISEDAQMLQASRFSVTQLEKAIEYATSDAKLAHVIDPAKHGFGDLVQAAGGRQEAMSQIVLSLSDGAGLPESGRFEVSRTVGGQSVTIRGAVVDGVPMIGTAFIPSAYPGSGS